MLPRSYKDVRLSKDVKPFRSPARHPQEIKASKFELITYLEKYLTKIGRMSLKKRLESNSKGMAASESTQQQLTSRTKVANRNDSKRQVSGQGHYSNR